MVPSHEPGKDDVLIYSQKVELLCAAWPEQKASDLIDIGAHGGAFQKPQLHQSELAVLERRASSALWACWEATGVAFRWRRRTKQSSSALRRDQ